MQEHLDTLITKHSGLVYAQLHKFKLINDPDAESIAYEALYNAIKNFDASKGNKISTVATVYIYNALGSYVRSLNTKRRIVTISYNNLIDAESDEEFVDFIPSDTDIEGEHLHRELCSAAIKAFNDSYDKLTNETHKKILAAWKASEFTAQTKDIASEVGVSQSYVSQIINNFKFSLRKKLEDIYYD